MSIDTIARTLNVSSATLNTWRALPEFRSQMTQTLESCRVESDSFISDKRRRIAVLQDMHDRLLEVVAERVEVETKLADAQIKAGLTPVPGIRTGLVIRRYKANKEEFREEYEVDKALVSEVRAIHERVARELGQDGGTQLDDAPLRDMIKMFDRKNQEYEEEQEKASIN